MGAWACESCTASLSLNVEGQATSRASTNWCGAGGHRVAGVTRWAPDAAKGTAEVVTVSPAPPAPALQVGQQGSLFF